MQPPVVIDRLLYVLAGAGTVAAPPVTITPLKVPASCNIVYVPFGTLVNVKSILPLAPHVVALVPRAVRVGADGAALTVSDIAGDSQLKLDVVTS